MIDNSKVVFNGKTFAQSQISKNRITLIHGDAAQVLAKLPDNHVQCVITSPPYYGQRDYGVDGQIGSEPSTESYVNHLIKIFRQIKRVLKEDGTFWLNLGDKYENGELLGMPWKIAFALKKDGWRLRSDIIWHKPNAMPSSVKNRPTQDHEYLFLFTKSNRYLYDADLIREPHKTFSENSKMRGGRKHLHERGGTPEKGKNSGNSNLHNARWDQAFHPLGRNKRTVWEIPLSKSRDLHFAVFPEKLVEPCLLAGAPLDSIVLDPFCGSGTTGRVATSFGRRFIGIDINKEYCLIARDKIINTQIKIDPNSL